MSGTVRRAPIRLSGLKALLTLPDPVQGCEHDVDLEGSADQTAGVCVFDRLFGVFKVRQVDLEFAGLPLAISCGPSDDHCKVVFERRHRQPRSLMRTALSGAQEDHTALARCTHLMDDGRSPCGLDAG